MINFDEIIKDIRAGWSANRLKNGLSELNVLGNFLESSSRTVSNRIHYDFMNAYLKSEQSFRSCFKSYIKDEALKTELDNMKEIFELMSDKVLILLVFIRVCLNLQSGFLGDMVRS